MRVMLQRRSAESERLVDGFYCSDCDWAHPFDHPKAVMGGSGNELAVAAGVFEQHDCAQYSKRETQHFQLEHPKQCTVLCDYSCDQTADYLDVDEYGHERHLCEQHSKLHTSDHKHAAVLPKRMPNSDLPYRSKPLA